MYLNLYIWKIFLHLEKCISFNIKYVFCDKYSYFEFVLYSLCILLYYFLKNFTSTLFSKFSLMISISAIFIFLYFILSIPYIYIVNSITVYKDALIHKNSHFSFKIEWLNERSMDGRICRPFLIRSFRRILEFSI